jgi:excisionase family DNA binding protein
MPRTKPKSEPAEQVPPPTTLVNGPTGDVMTLSEAAAYLRLPEAQVLQLVQQQDLPARHAGPEWRFFKPAIQAWLSEPGPKKRDFWEACAGAFKDDPDLEEIVKEVYRQRGRPMIEDE